MTISPDVPPDEVTMLGKCEVFSRYFLLPENSPSSYQFGLVTNIPWLYFWFMGKVLHLNFFGLSHIIFLRLTNIPIAFCTTYFVWRLLKLFTDDRLTQLLLIVAMTNTLMFSFLSSSISYDNLTNLLAAMAIYYLFAFSMHRSGNDLALFVLCQLVGCLTKVTFLPLAVALGVILIVREVRSIASLPMAFIGYFGRFHKKRIILAAGIFICLVCNIQLYGNNLLHYGVLEPAMEQVIPLEQAMNYRLTARNYIFNQFKDGQISIMQAWDMATRITHVKDRLDTIGLINNYASLQQSGFRPMGLLEYSGTWFNQMLATFFGIKAHISMPSQGLPFQALILLFSVTVISVVLRWKLSDSNCMYYSSMLLIIVFYAALLMYKVNYSEYLNSWNIGLTVAGRYLFPVIGPIYVLSSLYLMRLFTRSDARLTLAIAVTVILIGSDFPYFLLYAAPDWYLRP
jgi:hypothetical protein